MKFIVSFLVTKKKRRGQLDGSSFPKRTSVIFTSSWEKLVVTNLWSRKISYTNRDPLNLTTCHRPWRNTKFVFWREIPKATLNITETLNVKYWTKKLRVQQTELLAHTKLFCFCYLYICTEFFSSVIILRSSLRDCDNDLLHRESNVIYIVQLMLLVCLLNARKFKWWKWLILLYIVDNSIWIGFASGNANS